MIIQYILAGFAIVSIMALVRTSYIFDKEASDSLKFWQQRFNIVAADYQELQKLNTDLSQTATKLSNELYTCEIRNRPHD